MHRETRLARASAMITPLCGHHGGKLRMVGDIVDNLLGRAGTPLGDCVSVPPVEHVASKFGHRTGREYLQHRLTAFVQRTDPGLDRLQLIGETVFKVSFLRFVGAGE